MKYCVPVGYVEFEKSTVTFYSKQNQLIKFSGVIRNSNCNASQTLSAHVHILRTLDCLL